MSTYPVSLDSFTNPEPTDKLSVGAGGLSHAEMHGAAFDAIEAIESTLGTSPQGAASTVADRLTALESNRQVFIQADAPSAAGPWLWVDTSRPTALTFWIEDGLG